MKLLGFDVGGTKIEATILELSPSYDGSDGIFPCYLTETVQGLRRIASARRPTERENGYDHVVSQMASAAKEALLAAGVEAADLHSMGIGLPGAVDPLSQQMTNGNTLVLVRRPLVSDLAAALGFSGQIDVANDANCFALAEHYCGAGVKHADSMGDGLQPRQLTGVGIILGTGCGGGIVVQGRLLTGSRGGAGEIGHTVLYSHGHSCYCGQNGCAEQYLSGTAIEAHFASRKYSQVRDVVTAREIFAKAANSEPLAVAVLKQYKRDLGLFLAQLTNILDPHYFVFGGGVSLQAAIYDGLEDLVKVHAFLPDTRSAIYQNVLGDSAGVVGAAILPLVR